MKDSEIDYSQYQNDTTAYDLVWPSQPAELVVREVEVSIQHELDDLTTALLIDPERMESLFPTSEHLNRILNRTTPEVTQVPTEDPQDTVITEIPKLIKIPPTVH